VANARHPKASRFVQQRLFSGLNTQRTHYNHGTLHDDRKQQLDSIGFVWNLSPKLAPVRKEILPPLQGLKTF
jgi:hypothetical protein